MFLKCDIFKHFRLKYIQRYEYERCKMLYYFNAKLDSIALPTATPPDPFVGRTSTMLFNIRHLVLAHHNPHSIGVLLKNAAA